MNGGSHMAKRGAFPGQLAVNYIRVGGDHPGSIYSLQMQSTGCCAHAAGLGLTVVAEFVDKCSGQNLNRPALDKLRDFLKNTPDVKVVIVYDIERLTRNGAALFLMEEEFRQLDVILECVRGQRNGTDGDELYQYLMADFAGIELAKLVERSRHGKRAKALAGSVVVAARLPYGYQKQSESHGSRLVINEREAQIVRIIFTWYARGRPGCANGPMSISEIARCLSSGGVSNSEGSCAQPTRKDQLRAWSPQMVRRILTNETYAGTWYYGKTRVIAREKLANGGPETRCVSKRVRVPHNEWIPVAVPAIIDRELFDLAQERLSAGK